MDTFAREMPDILPAIIEKEARPPTLKLSPGLVKTMRRRSKDFSNEFG